MVDLANDYLELATAAGDKIKVLRKSHPRARRLRLTVTSGGARVTYPEGTHPAQVVAFLRKHGEWLERKLDELSLGSAPPVLKVGAATVMPLRGETTRLSWRDGAYPHIELNGDRLLHNLRAQTKDNPAFNRTQPSENLPSFDLGSLSMEGSAPRALGKLPMPTV